MLLKSLGCSRSLQKKACSVHRGNADSILRRDENISSSDAGLWPDVGRDFFIKATSRQAVRPVQCRITVLELGGSSPPNAALQEADESQLQAIPCGKRLPSAGVPTAFLLQGASDCCKGSFLFGRTTDFFFPPALKEMVLNSNLLISSAPCGALPWTILSWGLA